MNVELIKPNILHLIHIKYPGGEVSANKVLLIRRANVFSDTKLVFYYGVTVA
jgi:hypothetical protein